MIKVDKGINDKSIHKMSIGFTVVGDINEQEQHITLLTHDDYDKCSAGRIDRTNVPHANPSETLTTTLCNTHL